MKQHYKNHIKLHAESDVRRAPEENIATAVLKKYKNSTRPILIAIGGAGGIGKSTFALRLAEKLERAVVLALDDYKTAREIRAEKNIYGPHPEANQIELLRSHLEILRRGESIDKPVYCRKKGQIDTTEEFAPQEFVIVEGEIATYREFYDLMDFSIFIDSHWKTQLNTRITRDIEERGYTPQKALATFLRSNLHEFVEFGAESRNWADVHIHCDADYTLVIDAVCSKSASLLIDDVSPELAEIL